MKVIVLDDLRFRADAVNEAFKRRKFNAQLCFNSNDFMTAVETAEFDLAYVNVDVWNKGHCAYDYFSIGKKLQSRPIIFYNADELGFAGLAGRHPHERDRVFHKPFSIEEAISNT